MSSSRREFFRNVTTAALGASAVPLLAQATNADFYLQLVKANDLSIPAVLRELQAPQRTRSNIRQVGAHVEALAAAFCAPESSYFQQESLIAPLEKATLILLQAQHADGTVDSGNLNSPPDTGFVIETVGTALAVLRRRNDRRLATTRNNLDKFILAAGEALVTGGVHTPNHRWVVCSALARINSFFPAAKYVNRIDDWLGEGIYIDADGQYEERSTGIYSRVTDNALVTMARLLNRPGLLDPVRKNLDMTVYYLHPDGDVETVGSRRQDQSIGGSISYYYLEYRYLAIKDNNRSYAAVVNLIEQTLGDKIASGTSLNANPLINFLEEPLLKGKLPAGGAIPPDYAKVFPRSGLARIRRGPVSATIYGGSDWPMSVGSGVASNPTFFTFRKGKATLESVRLGATFFSEGAFHSAGLQVEGNRYSLHQRFEVPYYQPLPPSERNPQGDYPLTPAADERFWSKLNFPRRPVSNVQTLDQKVTVTENRGVFELRFDVSGHDGVPVAIELTFRPGGKLEGALQELTKDRIYLLKSGTGRYRVGEDLIEFGPGEAAHQRLNLGGPSYAAHGATLRPTGYCVYITGFTPFQRVLTIKSV